MSQYYLPELSRQEVSGYQFVKTIREEMRSNTQECVRNQECLRKRQQRSFSNGVRDFKAVSLPILTYSRGSPRPSRRSASTHAEQAVVRTLALDNSVRSRKARLCRITALLNLESERPSTTRREGPMGALQAYGDVKKRRNSLAAGPE